MREFSEKELLEIITPIVNKVFDELLGKKTYSDDCDTATNKLSEVSQFSVLETPLVHGVALTKWASTEQEPLMADFNKVKVFDELTVRTEVESIDVDDSIGGLLKLPRDKVPNFEWCDDLQVRSVNIEMASMGFDEPSEDVFDSRAATHNNVSNVNPNQVFFHVHPNRIVIGVVNRSQEGILFNRSIKEAKEQLECGDGHCCILFENGDSPRCCDLDHLASTFAVTDFPFDSVNCLIESLKMLDDEWISEYNPRTVLIPVFDPRGDKLSMAYTQQVPGLNELETAIFKAGGIGDSNYGDLHKMAWVRSSRTDKGVHSLATMISLKMEITDCAWKGVHDCAWKGVYSLATMISLKMEITDCALKGDPNSIALAEFVNSYLLENIRVFGILPSQGSFDSRRGGNLWKYAHLLPAEIIGIKSHFTEAKTDFHISDFNSVLNCFEEVPPVAQRLAEMPPVEDATGKFTEILDNIRHGLQQLPNAMVYLLVPSLFSNHSPLYFVSTKISFSKLGLTCHIAKIHSEALVEKYAKEIKDYIEEIYWGSNKRVLLLGHCKGGVDAEAALSIYWSDLKDKVAGLAIAQSPYGGSPIASDILREGQLGDYVNVRKLMEILICKVIKGDMQALEDLTYARRMEFLKKHPLPKELPVVSFHTEAGITPAVLATLSHIAHAELPLMATLSDGQPARLPVVIPLGAVMAACAQLLQVRYGQKSDGVVARCDAEAPGSVAVRPNRKLDHAWMVYSSLNDDPSEPGAAQVCEALLTLLVEVGQKKRRELSMKYE